MDAENEGPSTPKKKRQHRNELAKEEKGTSRRQKFRDEWLQVRFFLTSMCRQPDFFLTIRLLVVY